VFKSLLQIVPCLEERLMNSSEEEVTFIADMVSIPESAMKVVLTWFSLRRVRPTPDLTIQRV
jgi:hypothetical protein